MKRQNWGLGTGMLLLAVGVCGVASAEWASQRLTLHPGWNAVYFEVQPEDGRFESVFRGVPVKSIWQWNEKFTSVQYVRDPNELLPEAPEWLTYFPPGDPRAFLTDLRAVLAGEAYLIDMGGDTSVTLEVRGRVQVREKIWLSNSYNLVGFHVDPEISPTFAEYFRYSGAHAGEPMYRLSRAGEWVRITDPSTERIRRGEAYWIYCRGQSTYNGPLDVQVDRGRRLDYGLFVTEKNLRLRNETNQAKTVTLTVRPSSRPTRRPRDASSGDDLPPLAGEVKLAYRTLLQWAPFQEPLTIELRAGGEMDVPLAVLRGEMPEPATRDATFESIIEVRDGRGAFFNVPVSAQKMASQGGLWVGSVLVNKVSEASNNAELTVPKRAGGEFEFRVIVHIDGDGNARLLQEVVMMQVQPVLGQNNEVLQPAREVLVTREDLLPQFIGLSLRENQLVGRRISAPVFAHTKPPANPPNPATASSQWPIALGRFTPNGVLSGLIRVHYDDPLNPFVHRYHPDHDNLNERFETNNPLPAGVESFTFTREIRFEFSETSPLGLSVPNWGHDVMGGVYKETITGIHKNRIYVEGTFELTHASDVVVLNDGL